MSQLERQNQIIKILDTLDIGGSVSVKELAGILYASASSVRRDIIELEKRGLVSHIYGGVMPTKYRNSVVPVSIRSNENAQAKELVASRAAELVSDGDVIILDSSSTALRILPYLKGRKNLRIVTNNLLVPMQCELPDSEIYLTGGKYNAKNNNFTGPGAEEYINGISADICFFSCQGLSDDGEINDVSEQEISMRRAMISRAKRQVFLCDSSKIGVRKFATLCHISEISDVICNEQEKLEKLKNR